MLQKTIIEPNAQVLSPYRMSLMLLDEFSVLFCSNILFTDFDISGPCTLPVREYAICRFVIASPLAHQCLVASSRVYRAGVVVGFQIQEKCQNPYGWRQGLLKAVTKKYLMCNINRVLLFKNKLYKSSNSLCPR